MSEINKPEQHDREVQIFSSRHEPGVCAVWEWLRMRRAWCDRQWSQLAGDDLTRLQGEAQAITSLLRVIENGPRIKITERKIDHA